MKKTSTFLPIHLKVIFSFFLATSNASVNPDISIRSCFNPSVYSPLQQILNTTLINIGFVLLNLEVKLSASVSDIHFIAYTRTGPVYLSKSNATSSIDFSLPTKIVIHGWRTACRMQPYTSLFDAYNNLTQPYNIICVDWSALGGQNYLSGIIGLEAANPGFEFLPIFRALQKGDASTVVGWFSNAGLLGRREPYADINVFFNNICQSQCVEHVNLIKTVILSHFEVVYYWVDAIHNPDKYKAATCSKNGFTDCDFDKLVKVGENAMNTTPGNYYLKIGLDEVWPLPTIMNLRQ